MITITFQDIEAKELLQEMETRYQDLKGNGHENDLDAVAFKTIATKLRERGTPFRIVTGSDEQEYIRHNH
jgi:hypothetical protein